MANRFFSYHNTACRLIASYHKEMPLQHFLKQYFSENKKHGSNDRKWISHFCYSFYRLGKAVPEEDMEDRMRMAIYLCTEDLSPLEDYIPKAWPLTDELDARLTYLQAQYGFCIVDIFPFQDLLMPEIDILGLNKSFLQQPDVFLRIRPSRKNVVTEKLARANIESYTIEGDLVRIKGRLAIDRILDINKDVVIQDRNSQSIAQLFPREGIHSIWDCCAASGGKTLLLRDHYPKVRLTISDIRSSILENHKRRMQEAGINVQKYLVQDMTQPIDDINEEFDLIVCDVPCSGSGTWARTPEEMYFFERESLASMSSLQSAILQNAWSKVKKGGFLLYVTCSFFHEEDEDLIKRFLQKNIETVIVEQRFFVGIDAHADTLYGCLMQNKL